MKKVKFKTWNCIVTQKGLYTSNDMPRLDLIDAYTREPIATCTVATSFKPKENTIFIKDYSENEGMYEALKKAGVVGKITRTIPSGYIQILECEYLGIK